MCDYKNSHIPTSKGIHPLPLYTPPLCNLQVQKYTFVWKIGFSPLIILHNYTSLLYENWGRVYLCQFWNMYNLYSLDSPSIALFLISMPAFLSSISLLFLCSLSLDSFAFSSFVSLLNVAISSISCCNSVYSSSLPDLVFRNGDQFLPI